MTTSDIKQKLIAKIHVLKNQVKLDDDTYRSILERVAGKDSCKKMNMAELKAVIEEFNKLWFVQSPTYKTYQSKSNFNFVETSCSKMRKIFKLWQKLGEDEKLRDSSNNGLNNFLNNRFKTNYEQLNNSLHFNNGLKDNIIEALKSWYARD